MQIGSLKATIWLFDCYQKIWRGAVIFENHEMTNHFDHRLCLDCN